MKGQESCYKPVWDCRSCGAPLLETGRLRRYNETGSVFKLNGFPLASDLPLLAAPLELAMCSQCTLVQLLHSVDRDLMYREYWYRSGINESMVRELDSVARWALEHVQDHNRLDRLRVLDIGANDGTLLKAFGRHAPGCTRVGVDPANNVQELLQQQATVAVHDYWPCEVPHGPFHVITSIACLYDTDDLTAFCRAVARNLHPKGVWVLQVADLGSLVSQNQVDSICHEHVTYLGVTALHAALQRTGLQVVSLETNQTNGGSMRVAVAHMGSQVSRRGVDTRALDFGIWQARREVLALQALQSGVWFASIHHLRDLLAARLHDLPRGALWAYGASTKGNTLLQWLQLGPDQVVAVAERNPEKFGRHTATGIPIVSEEEWRKAAPPSTLVLPWHFREGILEREAAYLGRGGKLIFPLPTPQVITSGPVGFVSAPLSRGL